MTAPFPRASLPSRRFRLSIALCLCASLCASGPAFCGTSSLVTVPTAWRLENYMGNETVVWNTGATGNCSISSLSFDSNASNDDRNRFWATVMTGKVALKKVFIYYDDQSCKIISFGLQENG